MLVLACKLLLAPACVVAVSLAGRRWGTAVAGLLGGLPVVAGPILLVLTLVHGRRFGAEAAEGTLLGLAALTAFVVVYGRTAVHAGPAVSVCAGWAAFLLCTAPFTLIDPPNGVALIGIGAIFAAGLALLPPLPASGTPPERPSWDLPARALAALALVVALTTASGALGPELSGLLAPFPIVTSVLALFVHAQGGPAEVRVLLRGFLVGFYGFAAFCFTLATGLPHLGTAPAFALALAVALTIQFIVLRWKVRAGSEAASPHQAAAARSTAR